MESKLGFEPGPHWWEASALTLVGGERSHHCAILCSSIFGINTTSDISKLLYVISRAVRRVKLETILKYHEWYYAKYHVQIMLLFVYFTTRKRVCNFYM